MPRALISVSDKRGVVPFAEELVRRGWEIVSTGGTAALLDGAGVPVTPVDRVTGLPRDPRRARQDAAPGGSRRRARPP